ncbi:MAG TPA: hypothetical protein VK517_18820 [Cyclobacteriaceae bacterium]|nr:hypothetical protein [Cyclobacteriaceae bacterium]
MIADDIRETLNKVCKALSNHNVDYLVVGGAAVSYYGHKRPSAIIKSKPELKVDLDFWYNPTVSNFYNLLNALDDLAVDTADLRKIVFNPNRTFLKIPHEAFHTDFLPVMKGLSSYRESKKRSEKVQIDGNELYIIGYDDLVLNKRSVNRQIDKIDLDELGKKRASKNK